MAAVYKDISQLLPVAQEACKLFLELCEKAGLKVKLTETYRSQERQNELYAQGRTTPGPIVTWTKNSRHTSRRAWDICQNIKGREYDTSTGFFDKCGEIAANLGITWGGTWNTPDRPHFEVSTNWKIPNSFKEEMIDMEKLEALEKQVQQLSEELSDVKAKLPKTYMYTQDVPDWGRATVQKLLDLGYFSGAAADDLNLSEDMLRIFVVHDRMGLYD